MEPEMSKAVAMKCQGCWTDPQTGLTEGYMASGDSLGSLAYSYRLGHTTVRNSVHMVCAAIGKTMMERWRIFHRRINLHPQNVDTLVFAACILHNFLLFPRENARLLEEAEQQGRNLPSVRHMGGNRASREACNVREIFCTYFNSPQGSVSWQYRMV
ncbi:unnamed protein product [Boreogadus saida]